MYLKCVCGAQLRSRAEELGQFLEDKYSGMDDFIAQVGIFESFDLYRR